MRSPFTALGTALLAASAVIILGGTVLFILKHTNNSDSNNITATIFHAPQPTTANLNISIVGDIMLHTPMAKAGYNNDSHQYNFDSFFADITPTLQKFDLTIGNLETPVTGDGKNSGYPNFDAPIEILSALHKSGFDALSVANNHALDQGVKGLAATITNITKEGMTPLGGTLDPAEKYSSQIITKTIGTVSFNIGIIACTFGFNGYSMPSESSHLANIIDTEKIRATVAKLRSQNVDVIIIIPHWGIEYERTSNGEQRKLAQEFADMGIDIIAGSHPHVIQESEILKEVDQTPESTTTSRHGAITTYSLGNFISNQQDMYTDLGSLLDITLEKDITAGVTIIKASKIIPLYTHKYKAGDKRYYSVVPLNNALEQSNTDEADKTRILKYLGMEEYFRIKRPVEDTTTSARP